jgi:lysozyme
MCLGLIHEFEGEAGHHRPLPALDPAGNWEIGWGHKLSGPHYTKPPLSRADADALALSDLELAARAVCVRLDANALSEGQYAALIDFTFNEGVTAFSHSTLAQLVSKGAPAADEFDRWTYAHVNGVAVRMSGLVRRRAAEKALFLS